MTKRWGLCDVAGVPSPVWNDRWSERTLAERGKVDFDLIAAESGIGVLDTPFLLGKQSQLNLVVTPLFYRNWLACTDMSFDCIKIELYLLNMIIFQESKILWIHIEQKRANSQIDGGANKFYPGEIKSRKRLWKRQCETETAHSNTNLTDVRDNSTSAIIVRRSCDEIHIINVDNKIKAN